MRTQTIIFLTFAISLTSYGRNWIVDLHTGEMSENTICADPICDVQQVDDGLIVTYTFDNAKITLQSDSTNEVLWNLPGFNVNYVGGIPATLYRNDMFAIPEGYTYNIELLDSDYCDISSKLAMAKNPFEDDSIDVQTSEMSGHAGFYPEQIVSAMSRGRYRGVGVVYAHICPLQYNDDTGIVRAYNMIRYKLTYVKKQSEKRKVTDVSKTKYISTDDSFFNNFIKDERNNSLIYDINVKLELEDSLNLRLPILPSNPVAVTKDYLILTTNDMRSAADLFAEWKNTLGFNTTVISADRGEWTSYEDVKAVILDFYEQHPQLYYLLIIGKFNAVPAHNFNKPVQQRHRNYYTDYGYGILDEEEDEFPSIYVGRLPVADVDQANTVVNKIINYERYPETSKDMYNKALHLSYFESNKEDADVHIAELGRSVLTSEDIRNYLMDIKSMNIVRAYAAEIGADPQFYDGYPYANDEPLPDELKRPNFNWSYSSYDIAQQINDGLLYVVSCSHGMYDQWISPYFNVSAISTLRNKNKLPVIFSTSCRTGEFFHSDRSLTEAFLTNTRGGAVAVFAPTEDATKGLSDAMLCGMFDAIWPEPGLYPVFNRLTEHKPLTPTPTPTYELGQIMNQGKIRIDQSFKVMDWSYKVLDVEREIFHCFGDPSMKFTTDYPGTFDGKVEVQRGIRTVSVVVDAPTATISLYDKRLKRSVSYNGTVVSYPTLFPREVVVCVSGHNMKPYVDEYSDYKYDELRLQCLGFSSSKDNVVFDARKILVGENVDPDEVEGDVLFERGRITLRGEKIELHNGVTFGNCAETILKH